MARKHFQSHWKEMAEMKRARSQPRPNKANEKEEEETPVGKGNGNRSSRAKHPDESMGRARRLLHEYRYAAIAASVCFMALSLLGGFRGPERVDLDLVRVSGQVLVDGQPLKFGIINFVPENGRGSTGILDEEGRFTLTCLDGRDGALCGVHGIEIVPDGPPDELGMDWPLPRSFANYQTSGQTREITRSVADLTIELGTTAVQPDDQGGGDLGGLPSE